MDTSAAVLLCWYTAPPCAAIGPNGRVGEIWGQIFTTHTLTWKAGFSFDTGREVARESL